MTWRTTRSLAAVVDAPERPVCSKVPFSSEATARAAIRHQRSVLHGRPERLHPYKCWDCVDTWHLTSGGVSDARIRELVGHRPIEVER